MKALFFEKHGGLEELRYGEVSTPAIKATEVLIRVRACSINHLDLWILKGWPGLKLEMPHIGGSDIAGEIHAIGSEVRNSRVGTRVVVNPGYTTVEDEWTKKGEDSLSPGFKIIGENVRGGFAEFVAVPEKCLARLPDAMSFERGSAPLLAGLTSYRMLKRRAGLKAGESLVIVGAGGGVNSFSIQLGKVLGATVIALTSSEEKMRKAKSLGADHVINYKDFPDWNKEVRRITNNRGADVVVDNVGQETFTQSLKACARGGRIVTVGNTSGFDIRFDNRYVFTKQLSLLGSTMGSSEDFKAIIEMVWAGRINPIVDREMPLKDGKAAYELLEKGGQFGKVVLIP